MNEPNHSKQRKIARVLFDEYHSESWSISEARALEIQPKNPANSSYQIAAAALFDRDFILERNIQDSLHRTLLSRTDVLVLPHPCDPKWEKTTSGNPPRLSASEMADVQEFVRMGGGLIVISEYEHDKYGDNLNDLLVKFGLEIENTTVSDPTACLHENPTWFFGEAVVDEQCGGVAHRVNKACFYRAATCKASGDAHIAWRTSERADPACAGLIGLAKYGKGRVALITDSSLFGDKHIHEFDHLQLWLNLMYWCALPAFQPRLEPGQHTEAVVQLSQISRSEPWLSLKSAVNELRHLQNPDGSVETAHHKEAGRLVQSILAGISGLKESLTHQGDYLNQLPLDFQGWIKSGFQKPDFGKSLTAFNPQVGRKNHIEHLFVMPLYTPNASKDTRFEALLIRVPWPDWLAELERTAYKNDKFVPGNFVDFTDGYQSECAVLFPETISLKEKPTNHFSMIFCDREAKRLQSYSRKAVSEVHLALHPQLECFLSFLPVIHDAIALWDLIHDRSHALGELPFDPFMIRQRAPFWMYALEELRVDLRSFCEATRLAREGFPFAHYITYAILFDRIFRFPITGTRVRNYDALGGQLLFSFLHQQDVLIWSDSRLTVQWELLPAAVDRLREEIAALYKHGTDFSRVSFWIAAHDLISTHVKPNVASRWKQDSRAVSDESDPKKWIDLVHDDEFPLGSFHSHLLRRLSS